MASSGMVNWVHNRCILVFFIHLNNSLNKVSHELVSAIKCVL